MKFILKYLTILGIFIILGGFGFMAYTFNQSMDQWDNMHILSTVMLVGMILVFAGSFGKYLFNIFSNNSIQKKGTETTGTIVSVRQTGTYINEQPEVELTLTYKVNGEHITSSTIQVISLLEITKLAKGNQLLIKYLPESPTKFSLKKE